MGTFHLGSLTSLPASQRRDLLAIPTADALERLGWMDAVGVVEIDPELSDTVQSQEAYGLPPDGLANCVVAGTSTSARLRSFRCSAPST